MKISLITLSTPTYNNVRAASALPYHLIKGCRECEESWLKQLEFEVYSYNINEIDAEGIEKTESALGIKIHLLQRPTWQKWVMRFHLLFLRIFFKYPLCAYYRLNRETIDKIKSINPDGIWIYGEEIAGLAKNFEGIQTVVTMPDCESMYYYRLLSKRFATESLFQIWKYSFAYNQYLRMEQDSFVQGVKYHFVGNADAEFYRDTNPRADAFFIRHPLYEYKTKEIKFRSPMIKILIAGRNDIYMKEATDDLVQALCHTHSFNSLVSHYEITFLGKGWEDDVEQLKNTGYKVNYIRFALNYIEELQQHDIQITPISVGTGTKGKVLDAIANGLLEIGTPGALENIAVESNKSCIEYKNAEEAVDILKAVASNIQRFEQIAVEGTSVVLKKHSRRLIAKQLFSLFQYTGIAKNN
ncbi:glycosyltransferase [Prevotella sp. KH2C16]|uniref:glycosyltransferase n=1 Tax=Prevotella sp. KH2C16 TaxID=1855325 RepID=UPI0008F0BE3F|nr:glycosyltransferase [Prevotella sp. KH2C16]SFG53565.1 hypothetical protein SAMN05216383_11934 [Prevotella sp. KH2C16]